MIDKKELQVILKKDVQALETYRLELAKKAKPIYKKIRWLYLFFIFQILIYFSIYFLGSRIETIPNKTLAIILFILLPLLYRINYSLKTHIENPLKKMEKKFSLSYKPNVISPLIKTILPKAEYYPQKGISEKDFLSYKIIISSTFTKYRSEDLVKGTYKKVDFQFADIFLTKEIKRENKTTVSPVFNGLFINILLPKKVDSFSIISRSIGRKINIFGYRQLPEELSQYANTFTILDQIYSAASYNFTKRMLLLFSKFQNQNKASSVLHVVENKLYLAIHWDKDLFQPKLNESLLDLNILFPKKMKNKVLDSEAGFEQFSNQAIEKYYEEIICCVEILEEINTFVEEIKD